MDGKIAYSSDRVTWTAVADSPFSSSISSICYGNGKFVAGGYPMAYSTDGLTWIALADSPFSSSISSICYDGNGKYFAVSGKGEIAYFII